MVEAELNNQAMDVNPTDISGDGGVLKVTTLTLIHATFRVANNELSSLPAYIQC